MTVDNHSRKTFRVRLQQMLGVLRGEIMTGKRQAGEFLPSERDLVRRFHLSNKLVRVGLEQLASEGLIVKIPRVGSRVAEAIGEKAVTLRFGYHDTLEKDADIGELLAEFHKANPMIHVQPIPIGFRNYYSTVKEYMESGMLDVAAMNYDSYHHFRTNGSLGLLQDFEPDPGAYPILNQAFTHEDRVYAKPFLFAPLILCYNPEHFREKGIPLPFAPDHWDELMQTTSRLTVENERFGFYFFLLSKNRWPIFLLQNGVKVDPKRERTEESANRMLEGLSFCRDIIYAADTFPTYLSGSDADAEELFSQGKVSVIMTTYFALNSLRASGIPFDIAPLPGLRNRDTLLLTIGLAVNRKSNAVVAAQSLTNFLVSEQAQMIIGKKTLSIPARREAAEWNGQESGYKPPNFPIFRELLPRCRLFTDLNLTSMEMELIMKEARMFWSRMQTERRLRERIEEILEH